MTLTIETELKSIDVFSLNVAEYNAKEDRQVFLDGKRAHPFVEKAVLYYVDHQMLEYLIDLEEIKKKHSLT